MVSVRDDPRPEFVGGKLLPDIVVVAGNLGVRSVAQVGGHPRARRHRLPDPDPAGARMPQGDDHTGRRSLLDKGQGSLPFGRQRHDPDPTAGGLLVTAELIPVGVPRMHQGMRPSRPVLGCDIRPLNVEPHKRRIRGLRLLARPGQRP